MCDENRPIKTVNTQLLQFMSLHILLLNLYTHAHARKTSTHKLKPKQKNPQFHLPFQHLYHKGDKA